MAYLSHTQGLLASTLAMLLWGSWPNLQKASSVPWQTFSAAMALGSSLTMALGATLAAETPGVPWTVFVISPGPALMAFLAGSVCSAGGCNLLLAIDLVGMAVAMPVALGCEIVLGTTALYLIEIDSRGTELNWLVAGCLCVVFAIAFDVVAKLSLPEAAADASGPAKDSAKVADEAWAPLLEESPRPSAYVRSARGLRYAVLAGLALSTWPSIEAFDLRDALSVNEFVGPFALGAAVGAALLLPFYARDVADLDLRRAPRDALALALLAGAMWGAGTLLVFAASDAIGATVAISIPRCSPLVSAFYGVMLWDEFPLDTAPPKAKAALGAMFAAYTLGIVFFFLSIEDG